MYPALGLLPVLLPVSSEESCHLKRCAPSYYHHHLHERSQSAMETASRQGVPSGQDLVQTMSCKPGRCLPSTTARDTRCGNNAGTCGVGSHMAYPWSLGRLCNLA